MENHVVTRAQKSEISLKELVEKLIQWWHYLLRQWPLIVGVGVLGGIAGFLYANSKEPLYKARLTFVLEEEQRGSLGNIGGLASLAGINLGNTGGGLFQGANIEELYRSRSMLTKTLLAKSPNSDSLLIDRFIAFNGLDDKWEENPRLHQLQFSIPKENFTLQHDSVMGQVVKSINDEYLSVAKPGSSAGLIAIEVRSENEAFAKDFTEALVANVNQFYIETRTKKSFDNLSILQRQTDSIRRELNAAIGGVASATDQNPNANPALQRLKVSSSRRQVDVQANQTILSELVKNLELAKISVRKDAPLIQVVDHPIMPLPVEKVGRLKGLIVGGILAGVLIVFFLTLRLMLRNIMR